MNASRMRRQHGPARPWRAALISLPLLCWVHSSLAAQPPDSVGFVISGWGHAFSGNQLIQHWMRPDTERWSSSVPRNEWNGRLARVSPNRDALRRIKHGVGVDWRLFESGGLHFNLYRRHRTKAEGVRMRLGDSATLRRTQWWTLGGSMQQVRTDEGDRFIRFVPQLMVNPDGPHGATRRWSFSLEYGYWFGGDKRAAVAERVLQASLSARF